MRQRISRVMICFLVLVLTSALGAEILCYSNQTLLENGQWVVSKRKFIVNLMGGDEFVVTRPPLAQNRLHLGEWFGHQEITSRLTCRAREIRSTFVTKNAYVDLIYGATEQGRMGIRFAAKESFWFSEGRDTGWRRKFALPVTLDPEADHRVALSFSGDVPMLTLDERKIELPRTIAPAGAVGLRGGSGGGLVENFHMKCDDGNALDENFRNSKHWFAAFAFCALCILGLVLLFSKRNFQIALVGTSLVLLVIGGFYFAFDYFYWSTRPFSNSFNQIPSIHQPMTFIRAEDVRLKVLVGLYEVLGGTPRRPETLVKQGYPRVDLRLWHGPIYCGIDTEEACRLLDDGETQAMMDAPRAHLRWALIGTSQATGSGADDLAHTLFVRTQKLLNGALPPSRKMDAINLAVSGSEAPDLFKEYESRYWRFHPDLVVLDTVNNGEQEVLLAGLGKFMVFNRLKKIPTVLIQEPTALSTFPHMEERQKVVRAMAEQFGVPVFPLFETMKTYEEQDIGVLWWDTIHLTNFGQKLVAEKISEDLLSYLSTHRLKQTAYNQ